MRKLALRIAALRPRLLADRRGAVALILALVVPVLMCATALALEVSSWSVNKIALQRRADLAAYAAIMRYQAGDSAQTATGVGVTIAALNGATAASPAWTGASASPANTTTASDVAVSLVAGVRSASDNAMKAVVTTSIPLSFGGMLSTQSVVTVSATAYAEIVTTPGAGGQPCLLALNPSGTGINVQGGVAVSLSSCTVRSNAAVTVSNGSSVNAPWVYGTSVSITGGSSISNGTTTVTSTPTGSDTTAPIYEPAGQLANPYANNTAINSDFAALSPGSGSAYNLGNGANTSMSAGTYSSITVGGGAMLTMNPGLYMVNGNVSIANGASVTGSGVTIITSGTVSFGGGASVTLSAPTPITASGGSIPGILIAGNSTSTDTLSNGMKPTLTGVIYYPNGTIAVSGGVGVANGCLEMIAGSLSITNGASFGGSCTSYGATTFSSLPGTSSYGLVQ